MKILTILKKEYRDIVKKKSFIFSTIITPLLMGIFILIPILLSRVVKSEKNIYIADYSGFIAPQILGQKKANPLINFHLADIGKRDPQQIISLFQEKILKKKADGLLYIPAEVKDTRIIYYYSTNVANFDDNRYFSAMIQGIISKHILAEKNIDARLVEEATRDVSLETYKVKKKKVAKTNSTTEYLLSFYMMSTLFSIILGYGQIIMRGVLEEKNNRIVEILISSITSARLFYGKIIGVGLAGLTQVGIWIFLGVIIVTRFSLGLNPDLLGFFTFEVAVYFAIFFIIGYFMFSITFAIIGASVNSDQEAQQFSAPIIMIMFIPLIVGFLVTQDPNNIWTTVISFIPIFTPTLMFMRIIIASPPFFQIFLSIIISSLFTLFLAWVGAKIFRVGILMYGKKPSISELMKWVRYK